jgi:hypothetical protein
MRLQDVGVYEGIISTFGLLVTLLPAEVHMDIRPATPGEEEQYKNRPDR